ncbi:MAG: right-handed parallel beta-helix repeat-containing protein [Planctomycetota bacterium]|jgi:parallel beta-helix repeat protein
MSSKANRPASLIVSALLLSALCTVTAAKTIYVDDDATGANDGTSWENAHVYLQDALGAAAGGDEIRVAQGIYRPDLGGGNTPGDKRATFQLVNGVVIKGGLAGVGESDPDARNVDIYETILSGDLNGDDVAVANPEDLQDEPTRAENCFTVVTGNSIDETTVLDCLVITGGSTNSPIPSGGGLDNSEDSSPTLINCTFRANSSRYGGGAMANSKNSNPTLINCTFSGNLAARGAGAMRNSESSPILTDCTFSGNWGRYGGGMYNDNSDPTLTNCTFRDNSAEYGAGGMDNTESSPNLTNCTFSQNWTERNGGGMDNHHSSPILTNCTFSGNLASSDGGGIYNWSASSPILADCTFSANTAARGGGMSNDKSSPTLTNCTFSTNSADSGGGMSNTRSSSIVTNCTFGGNSAVRGGGMSNFENIPIYSGGMSSSNDEHPILTNCTFSGNSADDGGGMCNFDSNATLSNCTFAQNSAENGKASYCRAQFDTASNAELINCIIRNGGDEIWNGNNSTIVVTCSNVQGGFPGEGNIDVDPLFADPGYWADVNDPNIVVESNNPNAAWVDGDYHLKSEVGRWDPVSRSWVKDDVTSPCIDAGDPNSDWGREVWPHGGRVNMGAYGGTRQASMSTQPQAMSLPEVVYIYDHDIEAAESFQSLLTGYGCATTLIGLAEVATTALDSYDLIIVGDDSGLLSRWGDADSVAAVEGSGKPVLGLGEGGYAFFGQLGLSIGWPNGAHDSRNSILAIDPDSSHFSVPYPIAVPEDRTLQLYTETERVGIYMRTVPETVTVLAAEAGNPMYYPIALEHDRYVIWGFSQSPESMTETGRDLFANVAIRTANAAWKARTN